MNISGINNQLIQQSQQDSLASKKMSKADEIKDAQLKQACNDFEAVMTSQIMKQGLKAAQAINDNEEKDKGSEAYKDMANDQIAHHIGKQGLLGLADMIYTETKLAMGRRV